MILHLVYHQPLKNVVIEILLGVLLWIGLRCVLICRKPKLWRGVIVCLIGLTVLLIVYMTILKRSGGERELILLPGNFLQAAMRLPEIYRSLLMNVLLFVPFGLTMSTVFATKRKPWRCVWLTVLIAIGFSLAVEATQYFAALGRAETDDVLANTLGAFIGALHLPIACAITKRISKRNE